MKKIATILLVIAAMTGIGVRAQNTSNIALDADLNEDTLDVAYYKLLDDGGEGGYSHGNDYWVTVWSSGCDTMDSLTHFGLQIETADIGCLDTLYVYDGPSITSPLLLKMNNCYATSDLRTFTITATNTSRMLTIRFRTLPTNDSTYIRANYKGFSIAFKCIEPCESVETVLDSVYERTDQNGLVLSHHEFTTFPQTDTVFYYEHYTDSLGRLDSVMTDSVLRIDTVDWVPGATLCIGQGIIFHAHGNYTYNTGWYYPHDTTSMFRWGFGLSTSDTLAEINATTPLFLGYTDVGCYDVTVAITDEHGCAAKNYVKVQVRMAQNPMKTLYDLNPICNNDSLLVNVGYEGDNGLLTLRKIEFAKMKSKTNNVRTFIPDGKACGIECYNAPVTFDDFPGRNVQSAGDICSVCVNYEHSFMGDYSLSITCPSYDENVSITQGRAFLKFHGSESFKPANASTVGTTAGGGRFTGIPLLNPSDGGGDRLCGGTECDSVNNPFGKGYNYCFSRNADYTLVTGDRADAVDPAGAGIAASNHIATGTVTFPPILPGFCQAGDVFGPHNFQTKDSSDHLNRTDYFYPGDDFSGLIGCPLNGTWNIYICDDWAIDNGWVFSWSLDICGISSGGGCEYQVDIDSVVWYPDTNYATDFVDGIYRGLRINKKIGDSTSSFISSPDTAGDFGIIVKVYDEFGCVWDSMTHITSVYTPMPNLGNDTILCNANSMILDATDPHTPYGNYSFMWEPFGETTGRIETKTQTNADHNYVVEVKNEMRNKKCVARDTIMVAVNPQPIPNFDPGVYPLEGCEPFTVNITNTTTNGYKYRWVFGDGTYSTLKNPSHSYAAGTYDLKYYVESEKGCKDSLIYLDLITVHPSPQAAFSWEPVFPTVMHPSIALVNNTTPDNGNNKYFWEIQYDRDNPMSYHTLTDVNPTFEWTASSGNIEDVSGTYAIRLIARSDNRGPSGKLIQCADTVENSILIINDNLQFPTVVTPNGDGINDRFVIRNLVEGLAYPINTLDIYDKWGSRVFHATDIQSDDQFWDPSRNNIPTGTYFYRFSGKGYKGNIEHNGVIEIIK